MAENLAIFDFVLDAGDLAQIATMETGGSLFFSHRDPKREVDEREKAEPLDGTLVRFNQTDAAG